MADQLDCALDLMRRMPPANVEDNLGALLDLVPDLTEQLLSSVDQPLKIQRCPETGKDYLLCDYNRDGDSYRSPWSNKYEPALPDGATPSKRLRDIEIAANAAFDVYREMYYEGGVSSVYCWDLEEGFAMCILIKKAGDKGKKGAARGTWDAIHVVEITEKGKSANYKLTSTIILSLVTERPDVGIVTLGGSLTRQMEQPLEVNEHNPHIANIGRMVEDMENRMRGTVELIYFGKTKDIVEELRSFNSLHEARERDRMQKEMIAQMSQR